MNVETLVEIEKIKNLKAKYFRLFDTKQWSEWRKLFTDDVSAVYLNGLQTETRYQGLDDLVGRISKLAADCVTAHHGHMPEITMTGPSTATGVWAMFDYMRWPDAIFTGYGHYEEKYVKSGDDWKIKELVLRRLYVEHLKIKHQ